jgi:steroid 5-alpha reductase family enzyme
VSVPYPPAPGGEPYGVNPAADRKATQALIFSIVGLLCCFIFSIVAIVFAGQAEQQGSTNGQAKIARILGYVGIALWVVGLLFGVLGGGIAGLNSGGN